MKGNRLLTFLKESRIGSICREFDIRYLVLNKMVGVHEPLLSIYEDKSVKVYDLKATGECVRLA